MLRTARIWFCLAAALVAAAMADPLVESASNLGLFGRGSFTDHSNQDVLPALVAGLILGAIYVGLRIRRLLLGRPAAESAPAFGGTPPRLRTLLPIVFAMQVALLYAMETAEQFVVAGRVLGGTIWLGGPAPASLAVHGAFCVLVTLSFARLARALSQTAVRFVARIAAAIATAGRSSALTFLRVAYRADARRRAPLLSRSGDRAPPLVIA